MWNSCERAPLMPSRFPICVCVGLLGLLGCGNGPLEVEGKPSQSFSVTVGGELDLLLSNMFEYESPPAISSAAVRFLDVHVVGPNVPGGVTQRFRFKGEEPGEAVIVFREPGGGGVVEDTVRVH